MLVAASAVAAAARVVAGRACAEGVAGRLARRRWRVHACCRALASAAPSLRIDPAHVVRSEHEVELPHETLSDIVWANLQRWPDKIAMECGVTGRRLTYGQLRDASRRLAVALRSPRLLGPRRPDADGERVADAAVLMANAPEFATVLLGAAEARAVLTTMNPLYTPEEVGRQLLDSGARVVFADALCLPLAQAAVAAAQAQAQAQTQAPLLVRVGPGDAPQGVLRLEDLTGPSTALESADLPEPDPNAVALLPYSSGTTGMPKGVLLTHRNICANMRQMQHPQVRHLLPSEGDFQDVVPAVLPFFHIYGLVVVLANSMCGGARLVTLPKFDPQTYVRVLIEKKATALFAAPPLLLFLASHPSVPPQALAHLRFALCGAAPLAAADAERLLARAKPNTFDLVQGYGMTESAPVLTQGIRGFMGAVGTPVPNTEGVIVDVESGVSLPHGQEGELVFRGPQVMPGYWRRPEDTAVTLVDGWLRTGDVGRLDENGHFLIVDRAKELIKVKGFQVPPAELEALLRQHPSVAEAAVVGTPDARAGELPQAFVVLRAPPADAAAAAALRAALADHVAQHVAPHKQLKGGVRLVASIPKNTTGKILRRALRAQPPPEIAV